MRNQRVLILDDESSLRTALFRVLERKGFNVVTAQKIEEAKQLCQSDNYFDLAIVDIQLPDGNGIDFIEYFHEKSPQSKVIILTGNANVENAIKATQKGATHFLTKPFNLEDLIQVISKTLTEQASKTKLTDSNITPSKSFKFDQIIGESEQIRSVLEIIERVADSDSTVLITGESGTGKELMAKAIHFNSDRSDGPFVAINCGAIPSELLESELFGHVKGAFTGAIANRIGRFEMADGGTLFLDEIGDLEPSLQVKILRALQERTFEPVGGIKSISVNVRVIAATNLNLEEQVEAGKFREDLFYRLNVIPLIIPALRERKSDIPLLLNHFTKIFNKSKNKGISGYSNEAIECLTHYNWPGNIRELENLVERLSILKGHGIVEISDLPIKYKSQKNSSESCLNTMHIPEQGLDFNSAVDQFENALIMQALEKTGWNRNQAALLLRLNRTTLVEKMKKKGLKPNELDLNS